MKNVIIGVIVFIFTPLTCANVQSREWAYEAPIPVYDKARMLQDLQYLGVIYPEWFVRIACLESGHQFQHARNFNYWGFNRPGAPYSDYIDDDGNGQAKFKSRLQAYWFLLEWIEMAPPHPNEHPLQWLKRRGYNSEMPQYYEVLSNIVI